MNKKKKMLGGCLTAALALSTALSPVQALATPSSVTARVEAVAQSLRLGGIDRYETAAKIAQEGWKQSEYAILAAGADANLVDALTSAPLAKAKEAPILLTEGSDLNGYTEAELKRLGVKKVYLTTGTGVISQKVLDKLTALGIETIKLGGKDRFETSLNIAKEIKTFNKVFVATAWTNADALSAASIAAQKGMPILLTDSNQLTQSVASFINSEKDQIQGSYVLGGTGAIAEEVKNALPSAVRLGGSDRFETNQVILKNFAKSLNTGKSYVANGEDAHLVDALAGAPLAAKEGAPVVLTASSLSEATQEFVKLNLAANFVALGGETVVSDTVLNGLSQVKVYSTSGAVEGSANTSTPVQVTENVAITADNVTLQNAKLDYSVLIQGDQVKLSNVEVAGTIFVSVGSSGTVDLENVTAANVVVLTGAKAGTFTVMNSSDSKVKVNAKNVKANSITVYGEGRAEILSTDNTIQNVYIGGSATTYLSGQFNTVTMEGAGTLEADTSTQITNVVINSENTKDKIILDGHFTNIVISSNVQVVLAPGAKVENLVVNSDCDIDVDPTAEIDNRDDNGHQTNGSDEPEPPIDPPGPSTSGPTIQAISNGTISNNYLILSSDPLTFKNATIKVSQDSDLTLSVKNEDDTWSVLAVWELERGVNDIFSINNTKDINFGATLDALRESGVGAQDLFDAVDFDALYDALVNRTPEDEDLVYGENGILDTLVAAVEDSTNRQGIYESLNLYGIYSAADGDAQTQEAIRDALQPAVDNFNNPDVTVDILLGEDEAAREEALRIIKNSDQTVQFFEDVNLGLVFDALSQPGSNKTEMFDAVNFNAVFEAVRDGYTNKLDFYLYMADVFNQAFQLSADTKTAVQGAINYGEFMTAIINGYPEKGVKLTLTSGSKTKSYYVEIEAPAEFL